MTSPQRRPLTDSARPHLDRTSVHLDRAASQLDELAQVWPRAQTAIEPGTTRRWAERDQAVDEQGVRIPTPVAERCPDCRALRRRTPGYEQRDDVDGTVVHVFPGRPYCPNGCDGASGPGYGRAPLSVAALDDVVSVGAAMVELEDEVREALGLQPAERHVIVPPAQILGWHPPLVDARPPDRVLPARLVQPGSTLHPGQPAPQLLATRDPADALAWLASSVTALGDPDHADLLEHLVKETSRCARVLRSALGDLEQVALIKAPCPICDAMSLRAFPERDVVVCVNDACTCTATDCTDCTKGRRHRWPRDDWDRLALVLGVHPAPATGATA